MSVTNITGPDFNDPVCEGNLILCPDKLYPHPKICIPFTFSNFTCNYLPACAKCPLLESNPDIAGIGVLTAFIINAGLTLIFSIAYLLLRPRPPYPAINRLDKWLRIHVAEPLQRQFGLVRCELYTKCLLHTIISLSDQQLVLGIATLASSFYLYNRRQITVYHFSISMDLAWLSSNTHLLSLLVLHDYLSKTGKEWSPSINLAAMRPNKHIDDFDEGFLGMKVFRAMCMAALAIMLQVGVVVQGSREWPNSATCPANCVLKNNYGGVPLLWMVLNTILIVWGYPVYILAIFRHSRGEWLATRGWVERLHNALMRRLRHSHLFWVYWSAIAVFNVIWQILASLTLDIKLQIMWFVLGVYYILRDRAWGQFYLSSDEREKENAWGFGQVVPLMLLALPFMNMAEVFHDRIKKP